MTIIDLINKAGLQNVKVQPLHQSFKGFHANKQDSVVEFYTSHENAQALAQTALGNEGSVTGLVLWFPTEKIK